MPVNVWLDFVRREPLDGSIDGDVPRCERYYDGIYEQCANRATHIEVFEIKGDAKRAGQTTKLYKCNRCCQENKV